MSPNEIKSSLVLSGCTQVSIARALNVSPASVNDVITGKTVSARIREAIAEAIGRPVEEIWPEAKPATQEAA
jgi:lambda repressor-like predicted transcriptional regulator